MFVFQGDRKLFVRGVTYGPFRPEPDGCEYHTPEVVDRDFALMAAHGINAVRVYTLPPRWLLDAAGRHGLHVMVGIPWEQHVTFLDDQVRARSIEQRVREGVRACAGHPALLCLAVGNEIPSSVVRWHGPRAIERFIRRLYAAAKEEDPEALVTYVNYPTTEYLDLPFLDLFCFNVYLESQQPLEDYLARLQNLAEDRPLILAEVGLDSRRHGLARQADTLDWQIRTVFASGAAGAFVFAWTDEWHRGGFDIDDWDFGLTDRSRQPKPALAAVRKAFAEAPFPPGMRWPRVSVVVCTYNGSRTIRSCCEGLRALEYPDFEVLVVDDGSTDSTGDLARSFGFRVIRTENCGLSAARNTGLEAATGEIVAYVDDDARPDPHWLYYLASAFKFPDVAGVGGPNIPPPGEGMIATCVARAPGGPVHVLFSDREAEHIPGCNMAFRREALKAVGGFDPRFRAAGDDVDLCWRILMRGWRIHFNGAAIVWHHRRNSILAYWRQQKGYGRAESQLEMKWPALFNDFGHVSWRGRIYGTIPGQFPPFTRARIYHGTWGAWPFQSMYSRNPGTLLSLPLMPEWYLLLGFLAALSFAGIWWRPLLLATPLLALVTMAPLADAIMNGAASALRRPWEPHTRRFALGALTAWLFLIQPAARLWGRLREGLTPWRRRGTPSFRWPARRTHTQWSEQWRDAPARLAEIEEALLEQSAVVRRGGDYDRWDLEVWGGLFGVVRARMAIEEHGGGRQLVRVLSRPKLTRLGAGLWWALTALNLWAVLTGHAGTMSLLFLVFLLFVVRAAGDCAAATATWTVALQIVGIGTDGRRR